MRLPQTIGLECARPGIGVFQRTLVPFSPSHASGRLVPSAMPRADVPRKEGQLPRALAAFGSVAGLGAAVRTIWRGGIGSLTPIGRQVLRSRIIFRDWQPSATTFNV